ncbi:hypothetical protein HYT92_01000 [Candidatus Pacearchaeota archaeon]|nr:hypothetical protein [Candidatus Pacearchaeota archaeon]
MKLKIAKGIAFEDCLGNLELVLSDVTKNVQAAIRLIKKAKDEEEMTDIEYDRLLKLVNANGTAKAANPRLLKELFNSGEEK